MYSLRSLRVRKIPGIRYPEIHSGKRQRERLIKTPFQWIMIPRNFCHIIHAAPVRQLHGQSVGIGNDNQIINLPHPDNAAIRIISAPEQFDTILRKIINSASSTTTTANIPSDQRNACMATGRPDKSANQRLPKRLRTAPDCNNSKFFISTHARETPSTSILPAKSRDINPEPKPNLLNFINQ